LQEASLALLRHPEYCVYAGSTTQQARLSSAEAQPSILGERKFTEETLSNVNNQLKSATLKVLPAAQKGGELDNPTRLITEGPGEYIIVTLLAATWAICNCQRSTTLMTCVKLCVRLVEFLAKTAGDRGSVGQQKATHQPPTFNGRCGPETGLNHKGTKTLKDLISRLNGAEHVPFTGKDSGCLIADIFSHESD